MDLKRPNQLAKSKHQKKPLKRPESKSVISSSAPEGLMRAGGGFIAAVERTVSGLGYDFVELERLPRGLIRVSIDRIPGREYNVGVSDYVTVEDCELITRQLQYVLEVEQLDYARLEVSSPGLDRPLRKLSDWQRFCGQAIDLTLKLPFEGRKKYQGILTQAVEGWCLVFMDGKIEKTLQFSLDEIREARLVAQIDFKGRHLRGADNHADTNGITKTAGSGDFTEEVPMTLTEEQKQ